RGNCVRTKGTARGNSALRDRLQDIDSPRGRVDELGKRKHRDGAGRNELGDRESLPGDPDRNWERVASASSVYRGRCRRAEQGMLDDRCGRGQWWSYGGARQFADDYGGGIVGSDAHPVGILERRQD